MNQDFESSDTEKHVHVTPLSYEVTPDGSTETLGIHTCNASLEEAKEVVAHSRGIDPESIEVVDPEKTMRDAKALGRTSSRRTFGISDWGGSNWVPSGPQGNPNLN